MKLVEYIGLGMILIAMVMAASVLSILIAN